MGDLLLIGLVHGKNKKLDWAKGRAVARKLPLADITTALDEHVGFAGDSAREARSMVNDIITELKEELAKAGDSPSAYTWTVGTKVLHIRGGASFDGQDPNHGWTVFANALAFPKVLKAIGFDL